MSLLEIHIPENWPPSGQENAGDASAATFAWCLRGTPGKLLRCSHGALGSMPAAERCHIVLPASRVLLSSVKPPAQNRRKFMQALPYAVEDRIMADPESIHVAADEEHENGEMPLAIVDRAWLRQVLDSLSGSGLKPVRADVETLLAPLEAAGVWTVIWRGHGGFVRQGPHGGIPLDGGDAEHPPASLQLAIAAADSKPASIRLYTDGASAPDLGAWSNALGLPVTAAGEWQRTAAEPGINLLQGEFSARSTNADWLPRLRPALMLAGLILGLQVILTIGDWAWLKFEKQRLTTSMEKSFRKAFPDAKVIVDAPLQMRRNLAELRRSAGMMEHNDFLPLLAQIAPGLGAQAQIRSIDYQQDELTIRLTLPDPAAAESLRASLPQARFIPGNSSPAGLEAELTIGK